MWHFGFFEEILDFNRDLKRLNYVTKPSPNGLILPIDLGIHIFFSILLTFIHFFFRRKSCGPMAREVCSGAYRWPWPGRCPVTSASSACTKRSGKRWNRSAGPGPIAGWWPPPWPGPRAAYSCGRSRSRWTWSSLAYSWTTRCRPGAGPWPCCGCTGTRAWRPCIVACHRRSSGACRRPRCCSSFTSTPNRCSDR